MSLIDVGQIAIAAIVSAGGIGGIIIGVIKFSLNRITDNLDKKYQASLDRKLEKYKFELSKKEYVSKTKFDTEFSLYRELSSSFADMLKAINGLIPGGYVLVPADKNERIEYEEKCYERAHPAVIKAQDVLNSNIPFISEKICDEYESLLHMARLQLSEYEEKFNVGNLDSDIEKTGFSHDAYKRTREMNAKWRALNVTIRNYISTLEVVEEK